MKRTITVLSVLSLVLLILGCPLQNPFSNLAPEEGDEVPSFSMPADVVEDVQRSGDGEFEFKTLLPVEMRIAVNLYDPNPIFDGGTSLLPRGFVPAVIVIEGNEGNTVYTGMTSTDGVFRAVVNLPATPEDLVLKLSAEGFETREVVITDMVDYSAIRRTMGMALPLTATPLLLSRQLTGTEDSDGDGVPDIYDADPDDPETAFINKVPAEGNMTIAFEDLFGRAQAGDADYNDFIAQYHITETSNGDGITQIRVDAKAVEKLAGYRHTFGVQINEFDGTATLKGVVINSDGAEMAIYVEEVKAPVPVGLFYDSRYAKDKHAWFTLTFDEEQQRGDEIELGLDDPPYNPYLDIITTGHDVHLIGEDPLPWSINRADTFRDGEGFPWALLVPTKWENPKETQRIEIPYPRFTLWRESGGEEHTDWYNHYYDPWVPPDDNLPPVVTFPQGDYMVTGAGTASVNGTYEQNGTFRGRPLYVQTGGGMNKIFSSLFTGHPFPPPWGNFWCIDPDVNTHSLLNLEYYKYGTTAFPGLTGWSDASGSTPAPTLKTIPISGSTALYWTLTVEYIFTDPDGDGEGASRFRWLRSTVANGPGEIIPGAEGRSYTTTNDDNGLYLRAEVTPVDDRGGEGIAEWSDSSGQIGG